MSLGLELSAFELGALSGIIGQELQGWYINNIYPLTDDGILVKFHRAEQQDKMLAIHVRTGIWITRYRMEGEEMTEFCRKARDHLLRYQLSSVNFVRGERVVKLEFSFRDKTKMMYAEFFGAGNIIITDTSDGILAILREVESKERKLSPALRYQLPKARKKPIQELTAEDIASSASIEGNLTRKVGSVVQLPERLLKEVIYRAGLRDEDDMNHANAQKIFSSLLSLEQEAYGERRFYMYSRSDGSIILSAVKLHHLTDGIEKELEMEQLDELLVKALMEKKSQVRVSAEQERLEKEMRRIRSAESMLKKLNERASALRKIAEMLSSGSLSLEDASTLLQTSGSSIKRIGDNWYMEGRRIDVDSAISLASRIYTESKEILNSAKQVEESISRMRQELDEIRRQTESGMEETVRIKRREERRRWFESYRWFFTPQSLLAVGGKDAGSNSVLVRKKMEQDDLVFHAEVVGSPFFILKGGKDADEISVREVAVATVSFSRAWREGLRAADAYCVRPSQVKLGAPSGMYLPRGSFVIEGERRYVKDVPLQLSVGVTKIDGRVVACCGPTESLRRYCPVLVQLRPGGFPPGTLAKKVLKLLREHMPEEKSLPTLDEIIRILPPGDSSIKLLVKGEGVSIPG